MLDLRNIRENKDEVLAQLKARNPNISLDVVLQLDTENRKLQNELDSLRARKNELSEIYAKEVRTKTEDKLKNLKDEGLQLGEQINELIEKRRLLSTNLNNELYQLPNLIDPRVPRSPNEEDYQLISTHGKQRDFDFKPKNHVEIAEKLGILDITRATKLAGSKFALLRGKGAELEAALQSYFREKLLSHNFSLVSPPILVNEETIRTAGTLSKFNSQLYHTDDGYKLVPTVEVSLVGQYRGETFNEKDLPFLDTAFTPSFRKEAGASNKYEKGLMRLHQFQKSEMVGITTPQDSERILQMMRTISEGMVNELELPGRTIILPAGDLGIQCGITYDIEVYSPGSIGKDGKIGRYLEVSSCSNCFDFQSRNGEIKYKPEQGGKPQYVHTLNGTALAIPRTLISILENYQQKDGSVEIPNVLRPYMRNCDSIKSN